MKTEERIVAEFGGGKIKTAFINVSDKHLNDAIRELKLEQIKRREKGAQVRQRSKLKRFMRRLWFTLRYRREHKSKRETEAVRTIGLLPEKAYAS